MKALKHGAYVIAGGIFLAGVGAFWVGLDGFNAFSAFNKGCLLLWGVALSALIMQGFEG